MEGVKHIDLTNKVIIITGGYGHLGKAIVCAMIEYGGLVYVLGRDKNKFTAAFSNVKNAAFEFCDISDSTSISSAIQNVISKSGKIDVLVNNAFYLSGKSPETMLDEDWNFGIDGTLSSAFKMIRQIIPVFKNQHSGKIINVSSMYGIMAPDFSIYEKAPDFLSPPHYGAAKAGLIQLTKYYASYLGKWNIQVNAISPGPFPSEITRKDIDFVSRLAEKTCLGRIGYPEDLAGVFVFLSSKAADFITGQNIVVDGGWTIK